MQESFIFSHVFNPYDVMLLVTAALAFLLALPLILKRDREKSDLLLAIFVITQGLYSFHNVMIYSATIGPTTLELFSPFHGIPRLVILGSQGLLLLWYAKAMMDHPLEMWTKLTWLAISFTTILICLNIYTVTLYADSKYVFVGGDWMLNILSVVIGRQALCQLRCYETSLQNTLSNVDRHSLFWLRVACIGFVSIWALPAIASLLVIIGYKPVAMMVGTFSNIPPLILMSAMVVYGQTHAISRPFSRTVQDDNLDDSETESATYSVNPDHTYRLDDLMLRVKVYQDPELRLEGLADSMDISPRTLSTLLNRHYKKSFYDFVNHYRVQDAQEQLSNTDKQGKPIQRVFEDAGFNSKTTFNTLFKKYTGQTPSEFRKHACEFNLQTSES